MIYTKGQAKKAIFAALDDILDVYLDAGEDCSLSARAMEIHGRLVLLWSYLEGSSAGDDGTRVRTESNRAILRALSDAASLTA